MSPLMHDDASDAAKALKGDAEAFARLYDRHAAVVLSLCRRTVPNGLSEADDAMQETFIHAFRSLSQLDDPSRFRPWIYGIARNVCLERRRASLRRAKHEGEAMKSAVANTSDSISRNGQLPAVDHADMNEQLSLLGRAIEQLDDDERLAVHLFYLQEDSAPQVMQSMPEKISRSNFYRLLARARAKISEFMMTAANEAQGASTGRIV